jgi:unspecific monooxygenase
MVQMYMYGVTRETELDANPASVDFMAYLREVIAERRRAPKEDLLSHMLTADPIDGQKLSEDEVISTAILLLNAGHEATVHTTGNAVKTILESGLDPARLFADEAQTAATVEECLRFDAPLHMFTRYALSDLEYDGTAFKKGDVIGLMLGAANRDPARFKDADTFDPFRSDGQNVSFGAGIHFCIGAPLARIELQVALATLFRRLPKLRLAAEPRYNNVYHFHGLERLDVSW